MGKHRLDEQQEPEQPVKQVAPCGRREWERVGEHCDYVKNDLLIIHYLPALLMR